MKYPGDNLEEGLKCFDYEKKISANEHFGNGIFPQKVFFDVEDMNILEINEEKQHLLWGYKLKLKWYDDRLQWPSECQKKQNKAYCKVLKDGLSNFQELIEVIILVELFCLIRC